MKTEQCFDGSVKLWVHGTYLGFARKHPFDHYYLFTFADVLHSEYSIIYLEQVVKFLKILNDVIKL